jgi:uncharacterized protein (DUF1697 family)
MRYIVLLRGINVGGKNIIKMADFKMALTAIDCTDIITYIQSGNIILTHKNIPTDKLSLKINTCLLKQFNLIVPVIVLTIDEWIKLINNNPFANLPMEQLHITFLAAAVTSTILNPEKYIKEYFTIIGRACYLNLEVAYSKAKLNNTYLEKQLGVSTTTRNWKTCLAINGFIE